MIKNIIVYDGLNGRGWSARMAVALGHDIRIKVQLLACCCDLARKKRTTGIYFVDLYEVGCGRIYHLGVIADAVLGVRRPNIDYKKDLVVLLNIIENGAEKYRI